jgi:hypothetical protein
LLEGSAKDERVRKASDKDCKLPPESHR